MPGKIPSIPKFKGDNFISFNSWILQFEAQLKALEVKNENTKWRDLLLCCTESSAFATVSNAIVSNGDISYEELKKLLQDTYCGPEYKRTLETKLRSLKYRPGQNIPAFCHELKTVVQEIYGLTDATVIESIAQNHILGKLEPSVQEPAKLLQLTGKCTLESILELVNSKSGENPYIPIDNQAVVASAVSNTSKDCTDGRIDKLESMVEKLCVQVAKLTDDKPNVRKSSSSVSCSHCGNTGHTKQRCYKLKDCYQCGRKGHIAKHCRDKNQAGNGTNRMNEMSSAHTKVSEGQCADIAIVPRIMLQAEMGGAKIPLLYDPGSMYSMITRAEFERLPQKPPLMPASRSGIGISGEKFELDGVAHLNIRFYREDGSSYLLEYQPVLVSSKIKSNILGMQTELQFKGATRDHLNRLLTFIPHNDVNITLKYWKESSNKESSCVQVAKATIVPTNSVKVDLQKGDEVLSRSKRIKMSENKNIFLPKKNRFSRVIDLSTSEDESTAYKETMHEEKINSLMDEVRVLRNELSLQKTARDLEKRDEQLNASRRVLEEQEAELLGYKSEVDTTIRENEKLRQSVEKYKNVIEQSRSEFENIEDEKEVLLRKRVAVERDDRAAVEEVGKLRDTVTRDKLKRAGNTMNLVEINLESEENQNSCIQPSTTVPEQLDESSDDDEPANRYNLRPRRNIVNYNRELVSYIAAFR